MFLFLNSRPIQCINTVDWWIIGSNPCQTECISTCSKFTCPSHIYKGFPGVLWFPLTVQTHACLSRLEIDLNCRVWKWLVTFALCVVETGTSRPLWGCSSLPWYCLLLPKNLFFCAFFHSTQTLHSILISLWQVSQGHSDVEFPPRRLYFSLLKIKDLSHKFLIEKKNGLKHFFTVKTAVLLYPGASFLF